MREEFIAWAIDSQSEEGHGLVGRYWWFNNKSPEIPPQLEGCRIALFETRALASQGLLSVRKSWKKARVVKAKVTVDV